MPRGRAGPRHPGAARPLATRLPLARLAAGTWPVNPWAEPAAAPLRRWLGGSSAALALRRPCRLLLLAAAACSGASAQAVSAGVRPTGMLLLPAGGPGNAYPGLTAKTISFFKFHFQNLLLFCLSCQAAGVGDVGAQGEPLVWSGVVRLCGLSRHGGCWDALTQNAPGCLWANAALGGGEQRGWLARSQGRRSGERRRTVPQASRSSGAARAPRRLPLEPVEVSLSAVS